MILTFFCIVAGVFAAQENPAYQNPDLPIEERIDDLLSRMSIEDKVGQMTLVEIGSLQQSGIVTYRLGGVLSGGGGSPNVNNVESWRSLTDLLMTQSLNTDLGIPLIYGIDAVHGHNNVNGTVIFPHNIGLGATHNPELLRRIGQVTACEMVATGIYWNYAPVVAVPQDIRWGRTYEGYAQDTELVTELTTAYLEGLQGESLSDSFTVAATPKHFIADGGTIFGTSTFGNYLLDQGDAIIEEETLRQIHLPPYEAVIESGAMVIMTSFSSWNGTKMHGNAYLLTDVLKGELGFDGFIVSDWQGIDQVGEDYYTAVVTAINAGIDMNMVPYDYPAFIETMLQAVENEDIPLERIDDAVRRILRVKFMLGLFENPYGARNLDDVVGSDAHSELARQAVSQSMVLLKNEDDLLPLSTDIGSILVAGPGANDIGIQSGGWTISWQGDLGNITPGTTIIDGIGNTASPETEIYFSRAGNFDGLNDSDGHPLITDVGIVVIGELPYAEGFGDRPDLFISEEEIAMIERVKDRSEKLIVILISGRPLLIEESLGLSDAFIAGFLPGTEGQGVADVLFGVQPFTGTLSYYFPHSMDQVPLSALMDDDEAPLFAIGDGITTGSIDDIELVNVTCGE